MVKYPPGLYLICLMKPRAATNLKLAIVLLAAGIVYLVGNGTVGLWDRDEPRYAQTSRQMLQNGDWIVPHYLDKVRTAKPVLIYWLQAGAMRIFGDTDFAARLPSVVAMLILLMILSVVLSRTIGPARAFWTVLIFSSSLLTIALAKICLTDAVLLLWITIAQLCLYAIFRGKGSWPVVLTMWIAVGLGGLTKGPVILGVQAATALVLGLLNHLARRRDPDIRPWAWLAGVRPLVGILVVAAIVGPWLYEIKRRSPEFIQTTVQHDVFSRILKPLEGHSGPPGYHLLTVWGTYLPWSLLLPMTLIVAWKNLRLPTTRFALAAVIGPWLMMEAVQTKLPHYLLPIFPPLAFLTADALVRSIRQHGRGLTSRGARVGIASWCIVMLLIGLSPWLFLIEFPATPKLPLLATTGVMFMAVGIIYRNFRKGRIESAARTMAFGTFAVVVVAYGYFLPRADFLRLSPETGADLRRLAPSQVGQVMMTDYMEPSLAFYQGGTIREAGDLGFGLRFLNQLPDWMVITTDAWNSAGAEMRSHWRIVTHHRGLYYAGGRIAEVLVVNKLPPP